MTDFVIGKDDFQDLEIRSGNSQDGFFYFYNAKKQRLVKQFILTETKTGIKTCCTVAFIEKSGRYTPRLELTKRQNNKLHTKNTQSTDKDKPVKARVELDNCHENFWSLIDYIYSMKQVDVPRSGWTAVSSEDKELLESMELNREFIQKVLTTFHTQEAQDLLVAAKKDDVNNLVAAVKQARNKKALIEINSLVEGDVAENRLQQWIRENDWVFGIEYTRRFETTRIGLHSDTDLLVESLDGFADLIELKQASAELLRYDGSHNCYYPSADLSQVIGQTIHYIRVMEDNRYLLMSEDDMNVLKPRAKVVIGRSSKLNDNEKSALRTLNDTLHNIEILTYDEIKQRAERIVANYEESSYFA